jgi:hypothetical protein
VLTNKRDKSISLNKTQSFFQKSIYRADCTNKVQQKLEYLRNLLEDPVQFKNIYRYAFDFARVSAGS